MGEGRKVQENLPVNIHVTISDYQKYWGKALKTGSQNSIAFCFTCRPDSEGGLDADLVSPWPGNTQMKREHTSRFAGGVKSIHSFCIALSESSVRLRMELKIQERLGLII